MIDNQDDDLIFFIPKLIEEDIYFIKSEYKSDAESTQTLPKEIQIEVPKPLQEPKKAITLPPLTQKVEIKTFTKPAAPIVEKLQASNLISKKVIVLVAYKDVEEVPSEVREALNKIFAALKIESNLIEIINVLAANPKNIEHYAYQYLILMGGKGKNIAFLQNYSGARDFYTTISHAGRKVYFCESMEVYLKDLELKKKFWGKLVELFK